MTSRCDIRIRAELTGYAVQPGNSVDLALVATNQSPVTEDTLVAVTSGIGEITLVGNTEIPTTGILIIDSTDRARAGALATVKPVNTASATAKLSKPISAGLVYDFTFRFARAGETTVGLPVVSADTDGAPTPQPGQDGPQSTAG